MLDIVLSYGLESVLIHRILIGFERILESIIKKNLIGRKGRKLMERDNE